MPGRRSIVGLTATGVVLALAAGFAPSASAAEFDTMRGYPAPGTPAKYNKVKVLKQGPKKARNVLVLIPGTSAGAASFRPVARSILQRLQGWQIWSIERRENLLEDHTMLRRYTSGSATGKQLVDYYLGWLTDPGIQPHFAPRSTEQTAFARDWGLKVAVQDIRRVVRAASRAERGATGRRDRHVVLGGHSLGGTITTAYASWNFGGRPGARDLDGLVYIDGASGMREPPTAAEARQNLAELQAGSPFLDLLGLGLPWTTGVFNVLGSTLAVAEPGRRSALQGFPLVPPSLRPPVPATNLASYGYAVDVDTSPEFLALVHSHIGQLATSGDPRGWVSGELGTARRAAKVFAEAGGLDGTAWYHPLRLSLDASSVNNGVRNPAQAVYGIDATKGRRVRLPMYAFDTALGAGRVGKATRALARQAGVPARKVTTVDRSRTFAHIDPLSATPAKNAFIKTLVPFLRRTCR